MKDSKKERFHSRSGWSYRKVNQLIGDINKILRDGNVTFVEEKVILAWFEANLIYEMGVVSAKSYTESKAFADLLNKLAHEDVSHPERASYIG